MGFSGGGSNILKSHTHDGSVAQDGGALNMDNVTQASLTAGDVVYSDGSHLQRLALGNVNDVLTAGAAAPTWAAGGGGGGSCVLVGSTTLPADAASISVTTSAVSFSDVSKICVSFSGICTAFPYPDIEMRINGLSGAFYDTEIMLLQGGAQTLTQQLNGNEITLSGGASRNRMISGEVDIWADTPAQDSGGYDTIIKYMGQTTGHPINSYWFGGNYDQPGSGVYTSFTGFSMVPSSGNFGTGFKLSVYKYNSQT